MTEPRTKWAMPDDITEACTDERLLERAALDFIQEILRHIVHGKTAKQAIAELDCWKNWFETVRRHHDPI